MASTYTSAITTPEIATTGARKRTVSDTIRNLFPGNDFLCLVESGLPSMKEVKQKKGLISKRKVDNTKYECFTYTPQAVTFTVATWTDIASSGFTVSSATGLRPKAVLLNTANMTTMRVGSVTSTTIKGTTIGSTAFTASAGDVLLLLGPAYEENSSSPYLLMKDEDNLYNCTQIFRFPAAISNTQGGNPHYGPSFWGRIKERVLVEGLRNVSHAMFFGERASSTETTTGTVLGDSFRTMRGLWNWSVSGGTSFDAHGAMTFEKFVGECALAMNDTVGQNTKLVMGCGTQVWADILKWVNDKMTILEPGDYNFFGVRTKKLLHARGAVEIMVLDMFDRGSMYKSTLVFEPDALEYIYKNKGPGDKQDRDFHPKLGIQSPDVDGVEDEILGEVSISVTDGGKNIHRITNWLA